MLEWRLGCSKRLTAGHSATGFAAHYSCVFLRLLKMCLMPNTWYRFCALFRGNGVVTATWADPRSQEGDGGQVPHGRRGTRRQTRGDGQEHTRGQSRVNPSVSNESHQSLTHSVSHSINPSVSQSFNQPINPSIHQWVCQSLSQSGRQTQSSYQSVNPWLSPFIHFINQSISQPVSQIGSHLVSHEANAGTSTRVSALFSVFWFLFSCLFLFLTGAADSGSDGGRPRQSHRRGAGTRRQREHKDEGSFHIRRSSYCVGLFCTCCVF